MVVGDQHAHAGGPGGGHAVDAGDAIIHGDDQVRGQGLPGQLDDRRRQAVAVLEAVGHQVIRAPEAQAGQPAHHQRGGGGAVGVVVAHHADAPVLFAGLLQQVHRGAQAVETVRVRQAAQAQLQLLFPGDAAGGQHPGQQRRHAGPVGHGVQGTAADLGKRTCAHQFSLAERRGKGPHRRLPSQDTPGPACCILLMAESAGG